MTVWIHADWKYNWLPLNIIVYCKEVIISYKEALLCLHWLSKNYHALFISPLCLLERETLCCFVQLNYLFWIDRFTVAMNRFKQIKWLWMKLKAEKALKTKTIYSRALKTQHLIQCQFLPEDRILPIIDNEIVKSYQFACIRCQKSKRFGLWLPWRGNSSRVAQNLKVTEWHNIILRAEKSFVTNIRFQ